ncbi:UNVERIFIED_CONTAM: Coronatine-insensitive protein 1 [Sesamum radiatum]|uniref:Coronatine-insensitive protein 1 n=1 Tax=Sesamum radiatum TaxID=300843 RepID=A0AAW2JXS7_SESRA
MLLGYVGESDEGLLEFSRGCPSLQKLEMRGCCFSERALAMAALRLTALRYLWVQGYRASGNGRDLLIMVRPNWNIELIPARQVCVEDQDGGQIIVEHPAHILAYYSLAGQRTDFPPSVRPLGPDILI